MNQPALKVVSFRPDPNEGVGPTLQALREAKGLSFADVSLRLKYSVRQVQALEAENWEALPRGLPLRGMVRNYARYLETDDNALLAMLDTQTSRSSVQASTDDTVARLAPVKAPKRERGSWSWGWLLVFIILLIVAGFYAIERSWVPESWLIFDWLSPTKK